ncbi:hypothetical protein CHUAL_006299 [Chamberlinius hualienensis]
MEKSFSICGDLSFVEKVVRGIHSIYALNPKGETAIVIAAKEGNVKMIKTLVPMFFPAIKHLERMISKNTGLKFKLTKLYGHIRNPLNFLALSCIMQNNIIDAIVIDFLR